MNDESDEELVLVRTTADRVGLLVFAIVLWTFAAWMFWLVGKFAAGDGWWDFGARLVLHEFILAVGLLGLASIAHACFPKATEGVFEKAVGKTALIAFSLLGLFFLSLAFVALVVPVLLHFRILD